MPKKTPLTPQLKVLQDQISFSSDTINNNNTKDISQALETVQKYLDQNQSKHIKIIFTKKIIIKTLFYACTNKKFEICHLLLDFFIANNFLTLFKMKDKEGKNILWLAARTGSSDMIKKIHAATKADPEIYQADSNRLEPLTIADRKNHTEAVKTLIHFLIQAKLVTKTDPKGYTVFHYACIHNLTEEMDTLIKLGAKVDSISNAFTTPLRSAAFKNNYLAVEFLLKETREEVREFLIAYLDSDRNSPLHFASKNNNEAMAELLLSYGADITVKNKESKTALDIALEQSTLNSKLIEILCLHGAAIGLNLPDHVIDPAHKLSFDNCLLLGTKINGRPAKKHFSNSITGVNEAVKHISQLYSTGQSTRNIFRQCATISNSKKIKQFLIQLKPRAQTFSLVTVLQLWFIEHPEVLSKHLPKHIKNLPTDVLALIPNINAYLPHSSTTLASAASQEKSIIPGDDAQSTSSTNSSSSSITIAKSTTENQLEDFIEQIQTFIYKLQQYAATPTLASRLYKNKEKIFLLSLPIAILILPLGVLFAIGSVFKSLESSTQATLSTIFCSTIIIMITLSIFVTLCNRLPQDYSVLPISNLSINLKDNLEILKQALIGYESVFNEDGHDKKIKKSLATIIEEITDAVATKKALNSLIDILNLRLLPLARMMNDTITRHPNKLPPFPTPWKFFLPVENKDTSRVTTTEHIAQVFQRV